ncbi:MAG: polysaccharide pyruvyl transferase family protein [Deltaproteobacteria bacterium]|nr:polysaccharide pyruvyl transferase family protein [Deltaproteobacteria bacterium]
MKKNNEYCFGLIGWNGKKNVGDNAMTSVIINYIKQHYPNSKFKLLSDRNNLAHYTQDISCEVSGYAGYDALHRVPYIRRLLRRCLFLRRFVKQSDVILIGGGSIFHRMHSSYWHREVAIMKKKQNANAIVGAIGVSLGPFNNQKEINECEKALNAFDFVTLRDAKSFSFINEMNISTSAIRALDLAILLPDMISYNAENNYAGSLNAIGVALRHEKVSKEHLNYLAHCFNLMMANYANMQLFLFIFCRDKYVGDHDITNELHQRIEDKTRVKIIDYSENPLLFYKIISTCKLMISMRLHAAIIAYTVGTPFVMLSYAEKCISFAHEIGLRPDHIFEMDSLVSSTLDARLENCLESDQLTVKPWSLSLSAAKSRSLNNFAFLNRCLLDEI